MSSAKHCMICLISGCQLFVGSLYAQVGIGTASPTAGTRLDVVGSGITSSTAALRVRTANGTNLLVRDDGRVGIGTTEPGAGLEILTNGNILNALRVASNRDYNATPDVGIGFVYKFNAAGDYTSGAVISAIKENSISDDRSGGLRFLTSRSGDNTIAERMRISSSGNVGIGTTSPAYALEVNGRINSRNGEISLERFLTDQTGRRNWGFRTEVNTVGDFGIFESTANNTEPSERRLTILSGGNVGIGTNSPGYKLDVQGGDINASGSVRANAVALTSDIRLKNVLQSWDNDDQIDFVQYRWKNEADNRDHFGYLAQDVQKVLPDAVYTDNQGIMAVNYDEVHSYKLAMQEKRIKELEQTVEELKKLIKRKRARR